ncbi:SDR family NAD(P)-dependent oxidoreductase [Streptomyces fulvoviolaceus]|uniref:SDR family NAD(P)-dependent oxidoreductase n=1 Tax=Streptomyces fulvoviolaceus TaxID=285535 RepID=UPI0021C0C70B|nr:SDR family oxidoreductase [Streptomyces fulvoviolaceus]MCT9083645.1 SDR family oxidoreductase [Streptomyces fulvoviolaceus]
MADMRLDDKTVWVTGAGKGLGRAIAVALSEAGANVAVTARTAADLEELESELTGKVLVLPGSVDDSTAVRTMVERIIEWTGRLDAAVNCAGISPHFTRSERVTDEDWRRVLDINLQGTFYCCREAGKIMLAQGSGSIVNVSSVHASTGFERIAAYAASKGGVEALTKSLAVEWADRGVRVNALAPGYFHTDLSSGLLDSKWGERIVRSTPLGRVGNADELGGAAVFLTSDASRFVTGTTLTVDGGWTAR